MNKKIISAALALMMIGSTVSVNAATLSRLGGANRFETAKLINNRLNSRTLILASAFSFADALAATPLVHYSEGEIHLASTKLDDNTVASLKKGEFDRAYIIGGTGVINESIQNELVKYLGASNVERLGGANRYETSNLIVNEINELSDSLPYTFIVSGVDFADALSVAPIAAMTGSPVVLSNGNTIGASGIAATKKTTGGVYKIGGPTIVGNKFDTYIPSYERVYGKDRFETNQLVISEFRSLFTGDDVFVASGFDYPDSLTGSALAAQEKAPIVFTGVDSHYQNAKNSVKTLNKANITALGGKGVVSTNVLKELNSVTTTPAQNTAPTLTVSKTSVTIEQGTAISVSSFGATASDKEDGNITSKIKITGNYDINKVGTYNLNLSVTDSKGLTTTKAVTLTVKASSDQAFLQTVNQEILRLVNVERQKAGLSSLAWSTVSAPYATRKSEDMVKNDYFAHEDLSGKKMYDYMLEDGIKMLTWRENIARTYISSTPEATAKDLVNMWMNSTGHKANILSTDTTELANGVAFNEGQYGKEIIATQIFIKRQ